MLQAYKPPHHLNDAEAEAGTQIEQPGKQSRIGTAAQQQLGERRAGTEQRGRGDGDESAGP